MTGPNATKDVAYSQTLAGSATDADSDPLTYRLIGDPSCLTSPIVNVSESTRLRTEASAIALGVGAFGADHSDCTDLFGEFLAASGATAYLPPAGKGAPDYMASSGSFVPELQVLYGAVCEGGFSDFMRFESTGDSHGTALSDLMTSTLGIPGRDRAAVAMVAESAGLIGASLRRSPGQRAEAVLRDWLHWSRSCELHPW